MAPSIGCEPVICRVSTFLVSSSVRSIGVTVGTPAYLGLSRMGYCRRYVLPVFKLNGCRAQRRLAIEFIWDHGICVRDGVSLIRCGGSERNL
jgi:hypothetical protein